jgi:hypothetical protein
MKTLLIGFLFFAAIAPSYGETLATAREKLKWQYCYDHQRWLPEPGAETAALAISAKKFALEQFTDAWYWTCDAKLAGQLAARASKKDFDLKVFSAVINDPCLYRAKNRNELAVQATNLIGSGRLNLKKLQARLHAEVCGQRTGADSEKRFRQVLKTLVSPGDEKSAEQPEAGQMPAL